MAALVYTASSGSRDIEVEDDNMKTNSLRAKNEIPSDGSKYGLGVQIGVGCKPKWQQTVRKANSADTVESCGKVSYYLSAGERVLDTKYISFGVADGMREWTENGSILGSGVYESAFSKALCTGARNAFLKAVHPNPLDLMKKGYEHALEGGDENAGSSTAVVLTLDRLSGRLDSANLGNSGYLIIRSNKVMFRSIAQTYGLNIPFQLSFFPSSVTNNGTKKDKYMFGCNDSMVTTHTIQPGDVVIVGSSGLFANMVDDDILHVYEIVLNRFYKKHPEFYTAQNAWLSGTAVMPTSASLNDLRTAMRDLSFSLTWLADSFFHEKVRAQIIGGRPEDFVSSSDITAVAFYVYANSHDA